MNDGAAQAKILWNLLLLNGFLGRHRVAREYGEQSLTLARALNLKLQTAYTLNDLANYGYFAAGDPAAAVQASAEARALWRELDNLPMLSDNLNNAAILEYLRGNLDHAKIFNVEATTVSERTENAWGTGLAHTFTGCLAYEAGDFGTALQELEFGNALTREKKLGFLIVPATNLALLYASLGMIQEGLAVIQIAVDDVGIVLYRAPSKGALAYLTFLGGEIELAQTYLQGARSRTPEELEFSYLHGIIAHGEIYLALGEGHACIAVMQDILERLLSHGLKNHSADAELYLARGFQMAGDTENARNSYARSERAALDIGSNRALLAIYRYWAQFERTQRDLPAAEALTAKAEALQNQIADTLPERYRESFLRTNPLL